MALARINLPFGSGKKFLSLPFQNGSLTYNGTKQKPTWANYNSEQIKITGEIEAINVGTYIAYATPLDNCFWEDGTQDTKEITWTINKAAGTLSISANSIEVEIDTTTSITLTTTGDGAITVTSNNTSVATVSRNGNTITITGVKKGTATVTISVAEGTNYLAPQNVTCNVTVSKIKVTIPTVTNTSKTYNGNSQSPTVLNEPSSTVATCTGKTATNAGNYMLKYSLTNSNKYEWEDSSISDKSTAWSIAKAEGSLTLSATSGTVTYGTPKTFTVTGNTSGGALSVSSADTTYATASIDSNTVTVNCMKCRTETTVITVTSAETENYNSATATYTMTAAKAAGSLTLSATSGTININEDDRITFEIITESDGEITLTSNNTKLVSVSKNGNTVTVRATGDTFGGTNVIISQAEGTNHLAPSNKTYRVTVEADSVLNENAWETISLVSRAGKGDMFWDVGDAKEITLNGKVGNYLTLSNTKLCVFILHFNYPMNGKSENNIIWGGFKSALTDGSYVALVDSKYQEFIFDGSICFNMNHSFNGAKVDESNSNYGGWKGCDLRYDILGATLTPPSQYLQLKTAENEGYDANEEILLSPKANTLLAALPYELRLFMRLWTRWVDAVGNMSNTNAAIKATVDAITLLSEYEVWGSYFDITYANEYEKKHQTQMSYFANGNSELTIRHDQLPEQTRVHRWLCSQCRTVNSFCITTNDSSTFGSNYTQKMGTCGSSTVNAIAPAFKT